MGSNPSVKSYRSSHQVADKGRSYDKNFSLRYRSYLWSQEKVCLMKIVTINFENRNFHLLDFACGTGRILSYLAPITTTATGVDLSDTMLAEASKKTGPFSLVKADITAGNPFGGKKFDLITAFRFFPNSEDTLRTEAAMAISKLLASDGKFIFNNHKNTYSIVGLTMRLYCKLRGKEFRTMSLKKIYDLVEDCGMEIVRIHHTGVVPGYEWLMFLPRSWYFRLDSIFSKIGFMKHVALDQIVVCQMKSGS